MGKIARNTLAGLLLFGQYIFNMRYFQVDLDRSVSDVETFLTVAIVFGGPIWFLSIIDQVAAAVRE